MWLGEGARHLSPLGAQAGLADWSVLGVGVQVAWSDLALPPVARNRIFFFFFNFCGFSREESFHLLVILEVPRCLYLGTC